MFLLEFHADLSRYKEMRVHWTHYHCFFSRSWGHAPCTTRFSSAQHHCTY